MYARASHVPRFAYRRCIPEKDGRHESVRWWCWRCRSHRGRVTSSRSVKIAVRACVRPRAPCGPCRCASSIVAGDERTWERARTTERRWWLVDPVKCRKIRAAARCFSPDSRRRSTTERSARTSEREWETGGERERVRKGRRKETTASWREKERERRRKR